MKTLGDKLKYYRTIHNWSQEDMADKMHISLPAYSKIERNITDINYSRLVQIAKVFGITVSELVWLGTHSDELESLRKQLTEKEAEIIRLQHKLIEMLESRDK